MVISGSDRWTETAAPQSQVELLNVNCLFLVIVIVSVHGDPSPKRLTQYNVITVKEVSAIVSLLCRVQYFILIRVLFSGQLNERLQRKCSLVGGA